MAMTGMGGELLADETDAETIEAINDAIADGSPEIASAFLQCVEEMVEALQEISRGAGPWDDDPFQHATNTIEHMQALAVAVLTKHGIQPRGEAERVAAHESRHAVIARKLGLEVKRAVAGDEACVTTRYQMRDLDKVIAVDLAGTIGDPSTTACDADEASASANAMRLVRLRRGMAEDGAPSEAALADAAAVVERARQRAAALVALNMDAIMRVANELAKGGVLDGAAIDLMIGE